MKMQMALFFAPLFVPPAAMAQQTIMLPSLNADGGALSHVTNLPTSFIPIASVPIAVSTAGTVQLVAAVSGKAIYVTDWNVVAGGTGTFQLEYGTGTNCADRDDRAHRHNTPQRLSSAGLAWVTSSFRPATRSAS